MSINKEQARSHEGVEADEQEAGAGGLEPEAASQDQDVEDPGAPAAGPTSAPPLSGAPARRPRRRGRRRVAPESLPRRVYTAEQRLLILDTWLRSGLAAGDFAPLVGVSKHSLYEWKKRFEREGPAGLETRTRPKGGSRLSEPTKRAILLLKRTNPDWGQDRIHDMLLRSQGLKASPGAIGRVLEESGYVTVEEPTRPHPDKVRRFERARPNELWQTDLFTFVLKRQNRRVHLVAFMDDHSRFITGYGLHASASSALVREVFEAAIANYGAPTEVLTDNGPQYVTWRGKSAFTKLCERRGIKQVVAKPRRPRTLGKVERFWGSLWRECVEAAVFLDFNDARRRIGLFMDHYNFHRTHQGIGGLVPADSFFRSAPEVKQTLLARVAKNALELARDGLPRKDFYLTGRVGDVGISLHAEGEQVVLTREDGTREEVNLAATGRRSEGGESQDLPEPLTVAGVLPATPATEGDPAPAPGTSPLDAGLAQLGAALDAGAACPGADGEEDVEARADGDDADGEEPAEAAPDGAGEVA